MKTYTLPELVNKTDREFFTAAEICGVLKLDPKLYTVVKELGHSMIVKHRITDEFKVIDK